MLYGLQHLRFIAAMMVVFHHSIGRTLLIHDTSISGLYSYGAAGVDIFFVISGFIMVYILDKRPNTAPLDFFLQRLARIGPPYWIVTFFALFLNLYAPFFYFGPTDLWFTIKSALFIPTYRNGPGDLSPMIYPGWSLNFEMVFYALIPLALLISRKRYILLTSFFIVCVFTFSKHLESENVFFEFYSKNNGVILEFILGMMLGVLFLRKELTAAPIFGTILMIMGSVLLYIAWQEVQARDRFLYIGGPSLVIVAGFIMSEPIWSKFSISRRLIILGNASFAIYLTHLFFITPVTRVLMRSGYVEWSFASPLLTESIFMVGCMILGILFYLLVEKPVTAVARGGVNWITSRTSSRG